MQLTTPSGDGLRVVVKRERGKTIEQSQQSWCEAVLLSDVSVKPDAACKDISRLSFVPMQKEILYFNPELLFAELPEEGGYPDDGAPLFSPQKGGSPSTADGYPLRTSCSSPLKRDSAESAGGNQKELSPFKGDECSGAERSGTEGVTSYPDSYEGIGYDEIVKRLEEQLGGKPEHGARNSFIFTMACNLRYICNDDPQWVASILPTYGEDAQKHRATVQNAVNRPMSRTMPETMARALRIAKMGAEKGTSHSPLGGAGGGSSPASRLARTHRTAHLAHTETDDRGRGDGSVSTAGGAPL